MGIASGLALGGELAVVIMQNSGYATIGDALTSLAQLYKLPMLIVVSWRGLDPDRDFPEHSLMGEVTQDALDSYRVPYQELKDDDWKQTIRGNRCFIFFGAARCCRPFTFWLST